MKAPFRTANEARAAYYGQDGSPDDEDDPGGGDAEWHDAQREDVLAGGWVLASQDHRHDDRTRWFVLRARDDDMEFIASGGNVRTVGEDATMSDAPHFDTEQGARDAHAEWADENPDEAGDDDGDEWTDWARETQIEDWWIFARQHQTEDRVQFIIAGENSSGSTIYLGADGKVRDEPEIFEDVESIQQAIQTFYERLANGDVPDENQPTGGAPSPEQVAEDAEGADSGGAGGIVDFVRENPLVVGAVGAGVVYLASEGHLEMPDGGDMNV